MVENIGQISTGAVAPARFGSGERRDDEFVSPSAPNADSSDMCACRDRTDTRDDATGCASGVSVGGAWALDGPAPGVCSCTLYKDAGREDGGGGRRGMTGEAGVVGRDGDKVAAGAGDGDDTALRPARMAGTGVAIATGNDGGGAK